MKTIKILSLLVVIALVCTLTLMGSYTKSATYPKPPEWGGGMWKFTHTFVAATDTVYFPFSVPRSRSASDTIAVRADLYVAPSGQSGATDTCNVIWYYQWSDDNSIWSALGTAVGADSLTTGVSDTYNAPVQYCVSRYTQGGIHPYHRFVAIGKIPSGGKLNIIGNKLLVYLFRPYDY